MEARSDASFRFDYTAADGCSTATERSWLSQMWVYRRFVEGFSLIAAPLTKLLCKGVPFNWNDVQQESFEKLKEVLTKAPVLIQPGLGLFIELQVKPMWMDQIKGKQMEDESLGLRFPQVESRDTVDFGLNSKWVLCFRGRIFIMKDTDLRQSILRERHNSPYAMHLGGNKMYRDLRELHWWSSLKREVIDFVGKCLTCQQKLAKLYVSEIVRLHGVPVSIISDKDSRFTSRFWKKLHEAMGTRLDFSTAFHLQTDSQSKRVIQILEDMLKSYVIDLRGSWEDYLPLAERLRLDLTFKEEPVQILDYDVKVLRRKSIPLVKVLWLNHSSEEATWEPEETMRQQYPHLF
ncbi:uncharacterized protein LOC128280661 [Gossypium arboreum]|uniref:uncharacterized protein LOC128280661 n=1 Tax=Gossypium arboreum TaxID=29729 RepID=UPI0022F1548A|nr:uncharacterized protein LOC128280661 [Gossypium arboreum]